MRRIPFLFLLLFFANACATQFNPYTRKEEIIFMSDEEEVEIGRSLSRQVEKRFKVLEDFSAQARVSDVGQKIVEVCERRSILYYFKVLDKDDKNAFALPGGYVYVFKGLLEEVENDHELAYILAHEIAHIVARHSVDLLKKNLGFNILMVLAKAGAPDPETLRRTNSALDMLMLSYSREDELMADKLAVRFMQKAGFNPEGAISFLEKFKEIKRKEPIRPLYGRTHPYLNERMRAVREEIYGKISFEDYMNE
ncbi:MAG: M48 family metallopeptidase [Candidatus Omnitrophica bacterium]|nr:M48 family metallopeptidase [Candidatus Omnitrophota bacterium]MCM8793445.1 M48 family metallopeptidase [Candidatus Omnitrophota bacterium]